MNTGLPQSAAYELSVADHVARLNVMLKRRLGAYAKENFDLTIIETRLLLMLAMSESSTINHLAERSDIDRTQISRSVSVLVTRRLVSRSPGALDRREADLKLTRKGTAVHEKILGQLYAHNQTLISGLPPQTLATFFEVMEILIARART